MSENKTVDTNIIKNTLALPKSGCLNMIRVGKSISNNPFRNIIIVLTIFISRVKKSAKKSTKKGLNISELWKLKKYRSIQRFDPLTSIPMMYVIRSIKIKIAKKSFSLETKKVLPTFFTAKKIMNPTKV